MRAFTIDPQSADRRIDKWMLASFPALGYGLVRSAFRKKDVRLNGRHAAPDARLKAGDVVQIYLDDELLRQPEKRDRFLLNIRPRLNILYRDARFMLIDKPAGLICHPDAHEKVRTLLTEAQAFLYQKGLWDSMRPGAFAPALANRIDRFTGGLVMIALTEEALRELDMRIRLCEVEKRYVCIVSGCPRSMSGTLTDWLVKPEGAKRVAVCDRETKGAKLAQTAYRVLARRDGLSLVECTLLTGRTHQIRAQFAHASTPLLGDTQYGDARVNRRFGVEGQALYAYRLAFRFKTPGPLDDLNGQSWEAPRVPFAEERFGADWKRYITQD